MFQGKLRGLIFDFDGTLVLSNSIKKQAFIKVAAPYQNGSIIMQTLLKNGQKDRHGILKEFCKINGIVSHYHKLVHEFNEITTREVVAAKEVLGAREFLEYVRNDLRLVTCINTATPATEINKILELKCWAHFFDLVLGSGKGKLKNNIFAAKFFGIQPSEWLIIGDSNDDYEGAQGFGARFLAVEPLEQRITSDVKFKVRDYNSLHNSLIEGGK
ncbi:HAD family hydrolase [Alphaproteobacteria bacterium]|nr:HAD family hydrolase [Alphaproteobacteria bacterium]